MTLRGLYDERVPLYERYADITISEEGRGPGAAVDELRLLADGEELAYFGLIPVETVASRPQG